MQYINRMHVNNLMLHNVSNSLLVIVNKTQTNYKHCSKRFQISWDPLLDYTRFQASDAFKQKIRVVRHVSIDYTQLKTIPVPEA